jgi:hypothetical protein
VLVRTRYITIRGLGTVFLDLLAAQTQIQSVNARTNDAYGRGLNDAYRDYKGLNGHGYDDSCPSGHSDSFCINYEIGYHNAWNNMGR